MPKDLAGQPQAVLVLPLTGFSIAWERAHRRTLCMLCSGRRMKIKSTLDAPPPICESFDWAPVTS
jgi:hypothetical protein